MSEIIISLSNENLLDSANNSPFSAIKQAPENTRSVVDSPTLDEE